MGVEAEGRDGVNNQAWWGRGWVLGERLPCPLFGPSLSPAPSLSPCLSLSP